MKSDCPHCGKPIGRRLVWSRPAPGERRFLPLHAISVCPLCRGDLATNTHPLEKRLAFFMSGPLTVAMALLVSFPGPWTIALTGAALINCFVASGYLHAKTRNWPRYKRSLPGTRES